MGFVAQNFDGVAAAQRMIARGTAPYLSCLETVAYAIKGDVNSDNPGFYGMAIDGYAATPASRAHPYTASYKAPAGTVGYASTGNRPDGHVWINLGGDACVSTDTPSAGRIGVTTVSELKARMGITPLMWTDWFLGHNLVTPSGQLAGLDVTPIDEKAGKSMGVVIYNGKDSDTEIRFAFLGGGGLVIEALTRSQATQLIAANHVDLKGAVNAGTSYDAWIKAAKTSAGTVSVGDVKVDQSEVVAALKGLATSLAPTAIAKAILDEQSRRLQN